jgi:dipeptidyl aminopeptidase/acylaminoacyl peptidase
MPDQTSRLNAALRARYAIERQLGEGGMATVYLAEDLKHHRQVALKVLKPELAAVVGAERFLGEIETTAHLQHPHILPLFDSGEADSFLFYVMPYVEGETLRDRIDRDHQLPVDEAVRISRDLAEALDYAHRQGVIHRDIKPANILMHEGRPLIADFGIALAVGTAGGARLTETGLSVGTPYYMSPEQATGDMVVGPPSDIYALACVLYEMLVGDPPYTGSTAQAVLGKIIAGAAVSATGERSSVPANVDAAIRRALEKLPADRFATAKDFATALGDRTFRHGTEAGADGGPAAARWKRAALATGLVAGLALVAVGWLLLAPTPPPAVSRYQLAFPRGQEPVDLVSQSLALSPDGSSLVYVGAGRDGAESTPNQLWIKKRDEVRATPLAGTDSARAPSVSPDRRWIAYQVGRQLRKIPISGGASIPLADSLFNGAVPVAWLDDGTMVYVDEFWQLRRMPSNGGAANVVWTPPEGQFPFSPMALPDSRGLLFTLCDSTCDGWVLDLHTSEARSLVRGAVWTTYVSAGDIAYVRADGSVFAVPFDARSLEVTGSAVPVLEGVKVDAGLMPDLTVASDGTLVMMTGAPAVRGTEFDWVARDGTATPVDSGWTFDPGDANVGWALSPDGSRLAFRQRTGGNQDIWVKELPRGPLTRLTSDSALDQKPHWSPDGAWVTFQSSRAGGDRDVWTTRADGVGEPRLLFNAPMPIAASFWTPDGRWLVLRTSGPAGQLGGRDILAVRPGVDSVARPLLTSRFDEQGPAVSPDSRWIAYVTNETGSNEVVVRPFPDVDGGRWPVSTAGGGSPLWAHSGHELFYIDGKNDIIDVQVDIRNGFHVGEAKRLFHLGGEYYLTPDITGEYDITPDDQRFLFARRANAGRSTATATILVEHWTEELKAKLNGQG